MENKITLSDLVDLLANQTNAPQSEAEKFLKLLFQIIEETLPRDEQVKIKDFGTFKLTRVEARESVDVNSGEKIEIAAHNKINFFPATALRELVNKPFSHFETTLLNEGVSFPEMNEGMEEEDEFEADEISELVVYKETQKPDEVYPEREVIVKEVVVEEKTDILLPTLESSVYEEVFRSDKTLSNKPALRAKKSGVWIPILGGVAIALASLFFFKQWQTEKKPPITVEREPIEAVLPVKDTVQHIKPTPEIPKKPEKVVLQSGKTLRLLAEDKFGNREFWIYIYLKNKDKIKNPNFVAVGTELVIPDISEYDMDASNSQSVAKAKALGDKELKGM